VLEAPNADAVCQHHADRRVPCNDLHPVELRSGVPSFPPTTPELYAPPSRTSGTRALGHTRPGKEHAP
jgi:hypothetical protein